MTCPLVSVVQQTKALADSSHALRPPPDPVEKLISVGNELLAFMLFSTVICYFLYFYVAKTPLFKWASVGAMISMLLAWPAITGVSGVMLLDFWKPALGFRSCCEWRYRGESLQTEAHCGFECPFLPDSARLGHLPHPHERRGGLLVCSPLLLPPLGLPKGGGGDCREDKGRGIPPQCNCSKRKGNAQGTL